MYKVSPSQMTAWSNCPRLWFAQYVLGERSPSTGAQTRGTNVHTILERYLTEGVMPSAETEEGEIALSGIHLLPKPGTGFVEKKIFFHVTDAVVIHGFIDFTASTDKHTLILDHKTTSDFKYAKSEDQLRNDVQAIVYGWAEVEGSGRDLLGRWVYYRTKAKAPRVAKAVDFEIPYAELEESVQPFLDRAVFLAEMKDGSVKRRLNILDFEPRESHCNAYGGCYFKKYCKDIHPPMFDFGD